MQYNGQIGQDFFVRSCLKNKRNGVFVEIGSNDPIKINNTFLLETKYNWSGIMVEYDKKWLEKYKKIRPNSHHIINDATKIDWVNTFKDLNIPKNIDYLQIDLEVNNKSTIDCLENINKQIMNDYKFAVVTFEHDIYRGDYFDTRKRSREIFNERGYTRVFSDVKNGEIYPFEDWYIHPELVDVDYINKIKSDESLDYTVILDILSNNN